MKDFRNREILNGSTTPRLHIGHRDQHRSMDKQPLRLFNLHKARDFGGRVRLSVLSRKPGLSIISRLFLPFPTSRRHQHPPYLNEGAAYSHYVISRTQAIDVFVGTNCDKLWQSAFHCTWLTGLTEGLCDGSNTRVIRKI